MSRKITNYCLFHFLLVYFYLFIFKLNFTVIFQSKRQNRISGWLCISLGFQNTFYIVFFLRLKLYVQLLFIIVRFFFLKC